MPTESVTGIGGRDVSGDDPSLGGEYQGHPGLDEDDGDIHSQILRDRYQNLVDVYGPEQAKGMLTKQERERLKVSEGDILEYTSDQGIKYVGEVTKVFGHHVIIEVGDSHVSVDTRKYPPQYLGEEKKGLYYNVNKRKKQGKSPKKPGDKGYPTDKAWKDSAKTAKESEEKARRHWKC